MIQFEVPKATVALRAIAKHWIPLPDEGAARADKIREY